jgi:hypothetical protein
MTDTCLLVDFADAFAGSIDASDIHPCGRVVVGEWLNEARYAAERGDANEVKRLVAMVTDKLALERRWHQESLDAACRMGHRP